MKKSAVLLLSVSILISFTQCNTPSPDKLCSDADTRGKIISELMNNDAYMKEVMDSMKTKHGDAIVSTSCDMMKGDKVVGSKMMNSMMDMCMADTSMCRMMMGKTMDMCDADQGKCNMMMSSMQAHPNVTKSMEGMCDMKDMKGMKMDNKKEDHSQHH